MSDKVKLIVTLSKGQYENLKNIQCGSIGARMIVNAVKNGIPLDENKGEWILAYRDCGIEFYYCSKCNLGRAVIDGSFYKSLNEFKKCPNCGVDMRGEAE